MKITQIQDETIIYFNWIDRWIDGLRHYFGICHAWCPWCITEADRSTSPARRDKGNVHDDFEKEQKQKKLLE